MHRLSYYTRPHLHEGIPTPKTSYQHWGRFRPKGFLVVNNVRYTGKQIQNAILHGNWHAAVGLLKIFLKQKITKVHLRFLIESIHTVLLNHPSSSSELASHFESLTSSLKESRKSTSTLDEAKIDHAKKS